MHNISPKTLFIGKSFISLPMCHSTNEYADELILNNNFFEGTTIVATHQTKGKGQRGNSWESEPGKNLTFSIILKPHFLPLHNQFYLNIINSLAIIKTLTQYSNNFKIKWPNDIYWADFKLGGILIENKVRSNAIESSIVGIGINVNQLKYNNLKAISLSKITGTQISLQDLLEELLLNIEGYYLKLMSGKQEELLVEYLNNLYWKGEQRTFKSETTFQGIISGIDIYGRLEVLVKGATKYFDVKEIQFVE